MSKITTPFLEVPSIINENVRKALFWFFFGLCRSQTEVWNKESLKRLYSIPRGRLYLTGVIFNNGCQYSMFCCCKIILRPFWIPFKNFNFLESWLFFSRKTETICNKCVGWQHVGQILFFCRSPQEAKAITATVFSYVNTA